jgi:capsular polysaccharide transport system permease protein
MVNLVRRAEALVRGASGALEAPWLLPGTIGRALGRFFGSLNLWFWTIVGIPTLLAGVYYFGVASDLYVSEAQFVVHGPSRSPVTGIAAMLSGGADETSQDTKVVDAFVTSRGAVKQLEQKNDLRAILSRPEGDFLTRFPGLMFWRKDFEALYSTYGHFVSVQVDGASGIATLRVEAYRPADAERIAKALMADSEVLINDLNERARRDALATFQQEVDQAEQHLTTIGRELTAYRIKANMLDPKAEATGPFTLLAKLNQEEAAAKGQLADVLKNSPRSPQIGLLRTRIASLDKLIGEERSRITGNTGSVATAMTEYERLNLQMQMEQKILAQAVASREQARLNAQRQQLYLETITSPNLPDYPLLPKRAVSFATVVGSCLLAYGIAWLLIAGVREHASA